LKPHAVRARAVVVAAMTGRWQSAGKINPFSQRDAKVVGCIPAESYRAV